jgi:1,4-dihydroxy-2-naphthoyl-CoA hydrolase
VVAGPQLAIGLLTSEMNELPDFDLSAGGAFVAAMGLEFDAISGTEVLAHLEATAEHHTPWGIVHGGLYTSVVESVASIGASVAVHPEGRFAVGVNNQTDFLRPHRLGRLDVRATPIQQGRTLQLWLVEITNTDGKLVARGELRLFNQTLAPPG